MTVPNKSADNQHSTAKLPKAELHVHLEGTVSPQLAKQLAARNTMPLPEGIFNAKGDYNWSTFPEFLNSYDAASSVIRTTEDYVDVTYEYLMSIAKEGAIYAELTLGPDIPAMFGMEYMTYVNAVAEGVDKARKDSGIEARLIICMIRHLGPQTALELMRTVEKNPHPYVVGVGLAGNELMHHPADFAPAFAIADEKLGLGCTAHAGEVAGAQSVRDTIEALPVTRIGHGVRSIEDADLVKTLAARNISLEICPNSNIALSVYPDFAAHPLRKLYDAGVVGSLNSDDPPFFWTNLAQEYMTAKNDFGFTDAELTGITRKAIEVSFADAHTKQKLFAILNDCSASS
ncbi:MAG: adenosine deaminase [Alphaproteobacteria bacterium]|nr:adenosine deaminase [Alphaproteobacteria bacterium]